MAFETAPVSPPSSDTTAAGRRQVVFSDLRAGLIVFFVALPLCLGIATASGAPPVSGLLAGIVGGTVVALISGSSLSVAGPAAGLTVIVLEAIQQLGFRAFLLAVLLAGAFQALLGALRLGQVAKFVPNAVIRGMLAAIGLILVVKQLPHAIGYASAAVDGAAGGMLSRIDAGAVIVAALAGLTLFLWRDYPRLPLRRYVPRELAAVAVGLICSLLFLGTGLEFAEALRVSLPVLSETAGLSALWVAPDLAAITNPAVWKAAFTVAVVASIESLLSVSATDRLDPLGRQTSPDRELLAQGAGNFVSGLIGGLPVTAVVVRSFTNVQAGGQTRWSSVFHGVLLIAATLGLGAVLNHIPLAALAVVLVMVGYKLTPPKLYADMWRLGREQFVPFIATVVLIIATDLLTGTLAGIGVALFFMVWSHYRSAIVVTDDGPYRLVRFVSNVSFLHKARLERVLQTVPPGGHVILDGTRAATIDADVIDAIRELERKLAPRGVNLSIRRSKTAPHDYFRDEENAA